MMPRPERFCRALNELILINKPFKSLKRHTQKFKNGNLIHRLKTTDFTGFMNRSGMSKSEKARISKAALLFFDTRRQFDKFLFIGEIYGTEDQDVRS